MRIGLRGPKSVSIAAVAATVVLFGTLGYSFGTLGYSTDVVVIPNGASGYQFTTYPLSDPFDPFEPANWESMSPDDTTLEPGTMPFGTGVGGGCPLQAGVVTHWATPSILLALRTFVVPTRLGVLPTNIRIIGSVDDEIKIAINGHVLIHPQADSMGWLTHEGCPGTDDFTYAVPNEFLLPGTNVITLLARERFAESYLNIRMIRDPLRPIANAGPDQAVTERTNVQLNGSGSSDPDDEPIGFQWAQVPNGGPTVTITGGNSDGPTFTAPEVGPNGVDLEFELVVTDPHQLTDSERVTVRVMNHLDPPQCDLATADPDEIWQPNHKFVAINVSVPDPNGTALAVITGVTQDEPVNFLGDGDTGPDAMLIGPGVVMLRAERSGRGNQPSDGNGRVYRIEFRATGSAGQCTGTVTVCVPGDQGNRPNCVDDGLIFNSLVP
jgi:hypothetical protein